jgi:hypothetical protein
MAEASPRYSPWAHFLTTSLGAIALMAGSLLCLRDVRAWQLLMVPVAYVIGNAGEWHLHRGLLHHRHPPLEILYDRHTPRHHGVFIEDDMAIRSAREIRMVMFPPYAFAGGMLLLAPVALLLVLIGQPNLAALWMATVAGYFLSYEWLHLAFHLPAGSRIGRLGFVRALARNHSAHHDPARMQRANFNVTVPLWDLVRGTLEREHGSASDG